ncbi:MAG: CinA family protein [Pseudomonadota bacterium]
MADHSAIEILAQSLVTSLTEAEKVVATAESCTGGWIAKAITDIPGSSAVFHYGVVSYSNGAKESVLGVAAERIEAHGAVSEPVVVEMAEGVLALSGADIAVAVSGVAGPDGGTEAKPVGTVWFAWAVRHAGRVTVTTAMECFDGDRELVRELTVVHALEGIRTRMLA